MVFMHKAVIEILCENADIVKKSLEVEKGDEFTLEIEAMGDKLIIEITAEKISMLQAGINSVLRAVKTMI